MKTIYKSSLLLLAAILFLPAAMKGQTHDPNTSWGPEGVVLNKTLTRTADNAFNITMEAYVTGHTEQTEVVEHKGADIVLVLDASSQMSQQYVTGSVQYYPVEDEFTTRNLGGQIGIGDRSVNTQYYYLHGDGNYYQITSVVENYWLGQWRCFAYYTVNGTRYYLHPDGTVNTTLVTVGDNVFARYYTMYEGTLYRQVSTKLQAEIAAAGAFIDAVRADALTNGVTHNISIVKFAGDYYQSEASVAANNEIYNAGSWRNPVYYNRTSVVSNFIDVSGVTAQQEQDETVDIPNNVILKETIASITAAGPAYANRGMRKAQALLSQDGYKNDGNQKLVVFFTGSIPDDDVTNPAFDAANVANPAIGYSNQLKNNSNGDYGSNVTVFSVGLYASPSPQISSYLNGISSNYPNATAYNNLGDGDASQGYYQLSSTGNIFELIENLLTKSHDDISGGASYNLGVSAHIVDYLTDNFKMVGSTVTVQTAQCSSMADDGTPTAWNTAVTASNVTVTPNIANKSVDVYGFDFNDNYVGMDKKNGQNVPHKGKKLIISFPVQIDPSCVGGLSIPSNLQTSGIYVLDNGVNTQIAGFNVPTVDLPNIIISKTGLKAGESALFNVSKKTGTNTYGNPIQVWVTGDGTENAVTTTVKYLEPGTYKVEETGWSWSYTTATTPQEKTIGTEDNTTFSFTNTPKTGTPAHGEAATGNNVFSVAAGQSK